MQTLHLDLKAVKGDVVVLRCFWDNPNEYTDRTLPLSAITALTLTAEETYYVSAKTQVNLATTGQALFNWLDGNDRWLVSRLGQYPGEVIVLAIAVAGGLAHLPWEVLHDGAQFLVQRYPAVVAVRWLSSDQVTQLASVSEPQNRALRVLFMATSPRSVEPVLDYEQEEAAILKATARPSIGLVVEESGCLEELGYLADSYGTEPNGRRYFDVVHVTGHATTKDGEPKFITETPTGEAHYASPLELARTLKTPLPPLLFLSGCRTGQAGNAGAVPSMAEQLLQAGATAVLGWGQKVLDTDATSAAAALYEALSRSNSLAEAVGFAYQKLIEQQARDWHLLRLYVAKTLPGQLIKPERTPGWQRALSPSMATEFLDPLTRNIRVPTRESFVGRRRQLQNCLRSLTQSPDHLGVLIHGMGGLGKSSLAARLCDRLPQFKRSVWQGRIDPSNLVQKLAEAVDDASLRQRLIGQDEELKFRLRGVFTQLQTQGKPPFLLILDDFEENLEARGTGYILKTPAAAVLGALIWAIQDGDPRHRLILTSRYDFEMPSATVLYRQPMDALQGADLRKKCERLSALKPPELPPDATEDAKQAALAIWQLQEQAKQLADGNPRLLETLNDTVLEPATVDKAAALTQLAADPTDLRQQVLEDRVLQQMDADLQKMLSRGLIFELPVPRDAFAPVTLPPTNPPTLIDRAIALGLLEASPDHALRVPRLLPLSLPKDAEALYPEAAQSLYRLWWEADHPTSEEQALEIVRLGLLGHEGEVAAIVGDRVATRWVNSSRFEDARLLCREILQQFEDYRILGTIARAEKVLGETADAVAHYEKALILCPEEDLLEKAATLNNMAGVIAAQGDIDRAMQLWNQSLELKERINDVKGKAATLGNMARVIAAQGDIDRAMQLWNQSLELLERINDVKGKAATLGNMARVIAAQGDIDRAMQLWNQSLELYERINDVQGKAATLGNIAGVIADQGDIDRAMQLWNQSLELYERINDVQGKAATLGNMARVIAAQGDIDRAMQLWNQSLELLERINNVQGKAATLGNMAGVIADQGDIDRAMQLWNQSLELLERINDVQGKAATLNNMAGVIAAQGDIDRAMQLWNQSLELYERINDVQGKAATLNNMAGVIAAQGDIDRAMQLWNQSLELYERINDVQGKAATLNNMAGVIAAQGDIDRAMQLWNQSLELLERINDVQGKAATLNNMAGVIAAQGDIDRAMQLWNQSLELLERINNVQGKAATLANMAYVAGQQGNQARQLELNLQAALALAQARAYTDLFTVLSNLGGTAEDNPQRYLAQALWLGLRLQVPLTDLINLLRFFYNQVPQGDAVEALLATAALYVCQVRGEGHPQLNDMQNTSLQMLAGAAAAQGTSVDSMEALGNWMSQQQLNDPQVFLPKLNQRLETMVADQWLFDPRVFQ